MFHIYDDKTLESRLRLRRFKVCAVFAAGMACGLLFAQSGQGLAVATEIREAPVALATGCQDPYAGNTRLRLDCRLSRR